MEAFAYRDPRKSAEPFGFIEPQHFVRVEDGNAARELFKKSVEMVEIEVFSYCNRRCWFCPNATIDRISSNHYMEEPLYLGILGDLASIDYDARISYSRYNEPLAERVILKRIRQARSFLPRAVLHANTNGDYLTRDYLGELHDAGLNSLSIQIYLGNNDRFDDARILRRRAQMLAKLKQPWRVTVERPGEWHEAAVEFEDMLIRIYGRNFEANGCDRGGLVRIGAGYQRTSPCLSPFYHLYIDFDGSVVPCCNLRADAPEHRKYIVGRLGAGEDCFAICAASALVDWRREMVGFGAKDGPCASCTFVTFGDTAENVRAMEETLAAMPVCSTEGIEAAGAR